VEQYKFSGIAHRDHLFWSPLSGPKVDTVLGLIPITPGARVLDVGCGPAELLIRLAERHEIAGVGIDLSPYAIAEAQARIARRVPTADFALRQMDIAAYEAGQQAWDLALCIGSTGAYGGCRGALDTLRALLRPGGHLLVGELYWKREPDHAYLAAFGSASRDEIAATHAENVTAAISSGLTPLYASVANEDEWDHYEGLYARAIELYTAAHPEDPDCPAMRKRIGAWRDAYLRYGRATLGFALYLFQRP
jgi:cyclopropane fatty-acyl-phospholipid synthase-like methyltransferase